MDAVRRLREVSLHLVRSRVVASTELLPEAGARRPALAGGKVPQRVPVGDADAVAEALRVDGVVILTDMPGNENEQGYWERTAAALPSMCFGDDGLIAGDPPVSAVHHEFARSSQIRQLQAQQGKTGVINALSNDELLEMAEAQGMPHFTTVPWKEMAAANPHTDGCELCTQFVESAQRISSHDVTLLLSDTALLGAQTCTVTTCPIIFFC